MGLVTLPKLIHVYSNTQIEIVLVASVAMHFNKIMFNTFYLCRVTLVIAKKKNKLIIKSKKQKIEKKEEKTNRQLTTSKITTTLKVKLDHFSFYFKMNTI